MIIAGTMRNQRPTAEPNELDAHQLHYLREFSCSFLPSKDLTTTIFLDTLAVRIPVQPSRRSRSTPTARLLESATRRPQCRSYFSRV